MSENFDSKSKTWDQHQYRVERAQVVARAIESKIPLSEVKTALDFGCGTGLLGLNLADAVGHIVLSDTSPGMIEQVNQKLRTVRNASTLLLASDDLGRSFDLIVSLMVLHHIEDVGKQIACLSNAVEPGGYICLCDLDKEDGSFHQEETVPHNGFERVFIETLLTKSGMKIMDSSTVYTNRKTTKGEEREFPVFMIIGRKSL